MNNTQTTIGEAGFTLVEMMVVLVILTIGLLPLALVQTRAQQDVFESGAFSEAIRVAEMQMESARALGFGNIPPDSGQADSLYAWRRGVTNLSASMDQINITVSWNEKGTNRRVGVVNRVSVR